MLELVHKVAHSFSELYGKENWPISAGVSPLFAPDGLSSFEFVAFLSLMEEELEAQTGKTWILADDAAFSQKNSPFKTLESLAQYIASKND